MRRCSLGSFALLSLLMLLACGGPAKDAAKPLPVVAITQIATHPALDEVRAGLIAGLEKWGFKDGTTMTIVFKNANGDASLTLPIAQDFVRQNAAVIVPISTPSALSAAKATTTIPIVFSGVTDPVGTGLVKDLAHPGGNITGVSDQWPFEAQVRAFQKVFPKAKTIGMLYTRGDDVSKIGVDALTALFEDARILVASLARVSGG